jgi:hypothetical protein
MDGTLRPTIGRRIAGAPYGRIAKDVTRWIDTSPVLVRIALLFIAVLAVVSAFPARAGSRMLEDREVLTTPAPFMTCGIDLAFDPATGRCDRAKPAPLPCVESLHGCLATTATLPTPKPEPVAASQPPAADPFAGIMGITRDH